MEPIQQHVGKADLTAAGAGLLSFFKVIPWPEIAAFCSVVYFVSRGALAAWKWWRDR